MVRLELPKISDEELVKRYEKLKPIIRFQGRVYSLREFSLEELKSYRYPFNYDYLNDVEARIPESTLKHIEEYDFVCFHRYNSMYVVKFPTVSEVLSQIANFDNLCNAKYFEVTLTNGFEENLLGKTIRDSMLYYQFHVSDVRIYGTK